MATKIPTMKLYKVIHKKEHYTECKKESQAIHNEIIRIDDIYKMLLQMREDIYDIKKTLENLATE